MKRLLFCGFCLLLVAAAASAQYLVITVPVRDGLNPVVVPPITTYRWETASGSPDPAEVRWILEPLGDHNDSWQETIHYIRTNPDAAGWYPWQPYSPPDVGTLWTTPATAGGNYVFAVHGRDAGGVPDTLFDENWNVRRIRVMEGPVPVERTTWSRLKALFR
jgi:hypothetical protein